MNREVRELRRNLEVTAVRADRAIDLGVNIVTNTAVAKAKASVPFGEEIRFYSGQGHRLGGDVEEDPPLPTEPYPYAIESGTSVLPPVDAVVTEIAAEQESVDWTRLQ